MVDIQRFTVTPGLTKELDRTALAVGVLLYAPEIEWWTPTELSIRCNRDGIDRLRSSRLVQMQQMSADPLGEYLEVAVRLPIEFGGLMRDRLGRPLQGLPPVLFRSSVSVAMAVIDGAFSAANCSPHGAYWLIQCPNHFRSLALRGLLRRCGVDSHVGPPDGRCLSVRAEQRAGLERLGLSLPPLPNKLINREANSDSLEVLNRVRRSQQIDKTRWALGVLGEDVRRDFAEVARLRLSRGDASLDELAQMMEPPVTRHAICGILRRLHASALKIATESAQSRVVS